MKKPKYAEKKSILTERLEDGSIKLIFITEGKTVLELESNRVPSEVINLSVLKHFNDEPFSKISTD